MLLRHLLVQTREDRTNDTYCRVNLVNSVTTGTGIQSDRICLTALPDTDGDGMDDGWEGKYPTATEPDGDADSDGLTNKQEYQSSTDPTDSNGHLNGIGPSLSSSTQIQKAQRS